MYAIDLKRPNAISFFYGLCTRYVCMCSVLRLQAPSKSKIYVYNTILGGNVNRNRKAPCKRHNQWARPNGPTDTHTVHNMFILCDDAWARRDFMFCPCIFITHNGNETDVATNIQNSPAERERIGANWSDNGMWGEMKSIGSDFRHSIHSLHNENPFG